MIFCVLLALGVGIAAYFGYPDGAPSDDAVVRTGIGSDLMAGLPRGRQALVGSLRWGPLPTLLATPAAYVGPALSLSNEPNGAFGMCVAAAAAYALLCAFLNSWMRGIAFALRVPALLALYLSPWARAHIMSGSSAAVFVLLTTLTLCYLIEWWQNGDLRSLAYLSLVAGLGLITQYQFILIFIVAFLAVIVRIAMPALRSHSEGGRREPRESPDERRPRYPQATLILFVMPALYLAALWVAANWLIMGNPTFFARGLQSGAWQWQPLAGLMTAGCDWGALIAPLAVAIAAWMGARIFAGHGMAAGVPAVAIGLAVLVLMRAPASFVDDAAQTVALRLEECNESERVAVSGYSGYAVNHAASPRVRQLLWRSLSFYLGQALEQTRGKRLYIAVPPETSQYRWEDINLKFPRLYDAYPSFVIFERQLDDWRLLAVTRIDQPQP